MDNATDETLMELMVKKVAGIFLAITFVTILFWIAEKYLDPGLRKAIVYSGFGMC